MKIILLQELKPSQRTLKAIIPIRYLLFCEAKIFEFYEYPKDRVKEINFINHKTKETFNKNELRTYLNIFFI